MRQATDKQKLQEWEDLLYSIRQSTPVDLSENEEDRAKRIKRLEAPGNQEEWIKYYFPKYCFAAPAGFQIKSTKKVIPAERLYHSRVWCRGLSKTTRRMFEILYKKFVMKFPTNMLLCSKNEGNASRLLENYRATLEANQRLINDYGTQERAGKWGEGEFTTRDNATFRAVGAGQNPRGAKNEELRVTVIVFDDIDDDEVCRNPDRLQQVWEWVEQAVIPTVDISGKYLIAFDNNIIAEDSIAVRAQGYADFKEVVNIRDEFGDSTWPEKNSEKDIDDILGKMSYESSQKEYFNNPISQGTTFKDITYGKCPPLKEMEFVVIYADPATSNKDKPTLKSKAKNSCKSVVIVGCKDNKYYLYKCFLDVASNSTFIDWFYACMDFVNSATTAFYFVENNTLQDPFYEQVLLPLIFEKGRNRKGGTLPITPDGRDKPDKWFRIEGTLEPINRLGQLIFNTAEKEDPHMMRMESQFKTAKPTSRTLDGPDAVEGAVFITRIKNAVNAVGGIECIKRGVNNKRF